MGLIDKLDEEVEKIKEDMCDKYCKYPDQYGRTAKGGEEMVDAICRNCPLCKL